MEKRFLSMILCLIMLAGLFPTGALAESDISAQMMENDFAVQANFANVAEVTIDGVTTRYSDIEAAFTAAQSAGSATVKLLCDVTINRADGKPYGIKIEKGNITLDLNGCTISQKTLGNFWPLSAVFYLSSATLTVNDSGSGGAIIQPNGGPAIIAEYLATLTVESGSIQNTATGDKDDNIMHLTPNCAVKVEDGSTVIIKGGRLEGMRGAVVTGGELTVTGGTLKGTTGNALIVYGKTEHLSGGTVHLSGGEYESDDTHSIWVTDGDAIKGKAESLLKNGYRYEKADGTESAYSTDGNGVVGNTTVNPRPANEYEYIDEDGNSAVHSNCTEITAETTELSTGWYVVKNDVTIDGDLKIKGPQSVYLILCDGATLTVTGSVRLYNNNYTLLIYGQRNSTGTLKAGSPESTTPAIVMDASVSYAYIEFYGGTVVVQAAEGTYSIGKEKSGQSLGFHAGKGMKTVYTDKPNEYLYYYDKSGSSLTITKCKDHVWEYDARGERGHDAQCRLCNTIPLDTRGEPVIEDHEYSDWASEGADAHSRKCSQCGYTKTESHDLAVTANADGLTHSSKCSACGYAEANESHSFDEATGICSSCNAVRIAVYNNQAYATMASAINAAKGGGTVTLTADEVWGNVTITDGTTVTIDLNGKKWLGTIGGESLRPVPLTVSGGSITLKNGTLSQGSGGASAACGILITGGSLIVDENMTINGSVGADDLYYPAVDLQSGSLSLSVGTKLGYGIKVPNGHTLAEYLPEGTAFIVNGDAVNGYVQEQTGKFTLTVEKHTTHSVGADGKCGCGYACGHSGSVGDDGKCSVCDKQVYCAVVTVGGTATKCETIYKALDAVKDCTAEDNATVKLLCDIVPDRDVAYGEYNSIAKLVISNGTFTLDFNEHKISFFNESYYQCPLLYMSGGNITLKNGTMISGKADEEGGSFYQAYQTVVAGGGTLHIDNMEMVGSDSDFVIDVGTDAEATISNSNI